MQTMGKFQNITLSTMLGATLVLGATLAAYSAEREHSFCSNVNA